LRHATIVDACAAHVSPGIPQRTFLAPRTHREIKKEFVAARPPVNLLRVGSASRSTDMRYEIAAA
jgi:hypothetical protein